MSSSKISKYGFFIIILPVIFLVYSVASTSVLWIEPTDFGLASKLPLTYWIGLFFLGCLWYIGRESKYCLIMALVLTVSYLYVAPAIIRVPPWVSNSYYPFGESILINSTGHLVDRPLAGLTSYLDWPIFLYFASAFTLITGISHSILIKCFPLLTVSLYGLLTVLILRSKLRLSYAIFGAGWLLSSFFIRQHYFGPQGIAYIFFLLIFLIVSWLFFNEKANQRTLMALLFFLFLLATFTHPLASFMSLVLIAGLYLTYRLILKKPSTIIGRLFFASATIWFGYNIYFVTGFFSISIQHFYKILLGTRELGLYAEPTRIIGSKAMQINFMSSWGIVLLNGLIALLSIFLIIRHVRTGQIKKTSNIGYLLFSVLFLIMLGLFAFAGEYGAHEAYQRAFMFGLVPLSYLCVTLLARKPRIFIVILVGLLFVNIPAQYGGDTYRLATDTQLSGTAFIADYIPQDIHLIGKFSLYIRYHNPLKRYTILSIGVFPYTTVPNSSVVNEALSKSDYVMLSSLEDNYYMFFIGFNPLEQVSFEKCNRIYDNWRFRALEPTNMTSPS